MTKKRYVVGARRIRPEDRDVAGPILAQPESRYRDVIDSDDRRTELGEPTTYRAYLTDDEAEEFRNASNCRYLELDGRITADPALGATQVYRTDESSEELPELNVRDWLKADRDLDDKWHGRDQTVAVLDGGTSKAVRTYQNITLVDRKLFTDENPGSDGVTTVHGCYVTPNAVPHGGRLLEAVISDNSGSAYHSDSAEAMKWAADSGVKIVNYSYSGDSDSEVLRDAVRYLSDRDVQLYASAGNDGKYTLNYPAALCREFSNVHSSIAFDHRSDRRADFSNAHEDGSGCAPGVRVLSLNKAADLIRWSGTSASSPHSAYLCARGATGSTYTAAEVARALDTTTRDTPEPPEQEGAGAYQLRAALDKLGPEPEPEPEPELEPKLTWWQKFFQWWRSL